MGVIVIGLVAKPYLNQDSFTVEILPNKEPVSELTSAHKITIHIAGEVEQPGVYEVPAHWTTLDLISHLKLHPNANLDKLKLARPLKPNSRILIPKRIPKRSLKRKSRKVRKGKVNMNTASAIELASLPGVGPIMAKRIINFRQASGPFNSINALLGVKGIGPKTLKKMTPQIRIQ